MRRKLVPVIGFDLSLSRPAACTIPAGWRLGDWGTLDYRSVEPPGVGDAADLAGRYRRLSFVARWVIDLLWNEQQPWPDRIQHAFVEEYAFSARSSSVTKLAELGGVVRVAALEGRHTLLRPVVASQARRLILGRLPAKHAKVAVQQALYRAGAPFANDDECDAFVVANFGLSELGLTALTLA